MSEEGGDKPPFLMRFALGCELNRNRLRLFSQYINVMLAQQVESETRRKHWPRREE